MVVHASWVGVGKDTGVGIVFDGLGCGFVPAMGTTQQHAGFGHLFDNLPAEAVKPFVNCIHASASWGIGGVIRREHPAHAQAVIHIHHADMAVECFPAFNIEDDAQFALSFCGGNIIRLFNNLVLFSRSGMQPCRSILTGEVVILNDISG